MKGVGFKADEFRISGFDMRDVLVGQSVAYEFDVEVDDKVLPVKLLEDVKNGNMLIYTYFKLTIRSVKSAEWIDEEEEIG